MNEGGNQSEFYMNGFRERNSQRQDDGILNSETDDSANG